ncbi:MAG: hypothetical protein GY696_21395 [Gammaproteobacteria bacterium]|nr:hypothetical protein [Gammaproteobacteria bacterium]
MEFAGHSFRRGGATTALEAKATEAELMKLGRWRSTTYLRYLAPSAPYSRRMGLRLADTAIGATQK